METLTGTDLEFARRVLSDGELCAIPTETVYGLAANALQTNSVLKIFEVKNRPSFDPLIVHIADTDALKHVAREVPEKAKKLADEFWPGPLTLVLKKQPGIPDLVTSGLDTVGIRIPNHPITLGLLRSLPFPLAAPSANPFGYISPTTARHVADQLSGKIPYILDGGPCQVGIESTIVGFEGETCRILRLGGLSVESIRGVVGEVEINLHSNSQPAAPGMLTSHYAPRKPLVMGPIREMLGEFSSKNPAILSFSQSFPGYIHQCLSPSGDLREAARNLFAALRELDRSEAGIIIAEMVPPDGLGRAINDRLLRASAGSGR